jgi:hypothetical protein
MPPRRRTFYLADATLLSNPKILRLRRQHPDEWLSVLGGFHVLIGVATLNGSPKLSQDEISDVLGDQTDVIALLRDVGLMTPTGIDRATFNDWCPKPRPQYPSDKKPRKHSGGKGTDSGGVGRDSGGIGAESGGMPTSTTSSPSKASSSSRVVNGSASAADVLKQRDEEDAIERARLPRPRAV